MPNAATHPLFSIAAATLLALASPAFATSQRTFVSGAGSDANPCSISLACRSFSVAIAQTNADGEVIVLDSAGYGPFSVNKGISIIVPPGIYAGITVTSGPGIVVSAGTLDTVVLRGLTINGKGGIDGIVVNSAKQVHIEDCTITGMLNQGVYTPGGSYIRIANTLLRSNGLSGVYVPKGPTVTVAIENAHAVHNGQYGYYLQGGSQVMLYNSSATDNVVAGVYYQANDGSPGVMIVGGEISGNAGAGLSLVSDTGAHASLAVFRTSASRNFKDGIYSQATFPLTDSPEPSAHSSISHSHVTWNGGSGLAGGSFPSNINYLAISHSVFSENGVWGVAAIGGSRVRMGVHYNSVQRNADFDFAQQNSGQIYAFGTNALTGNPGNADILGTLSPKSLH